MNRYVKDIIFSFLLLVLFVSAVAVAYIVDQMAFKLGMVQYERQHEWR